MITEGEFARHYLIPDARYANLGACPKDPDAPTINVPDYWGFRK